MTAPSSLLPSRLRPLAALSLLGLCLLGAPSARADSPWVLLEELRAELQKSGPLTARFEQTYIPAGFSSGDRESGHFSLHLPECLRWNYAEPQEKSFLVCGNEVWFWNEGEDSGRHYLIEPENEPGLDLLLVEVARLRERYTASSERLEDGTYRVALALPGEASGFQAELRIDPTLHRVMGMEYTDREGNRTRFEIAGYTDLAHTALFKAPTGLEWIEE